ncbi:MAG: biotin synthase BioB [Rikenellaceae bacterium]|nr:biotin synthase BioB [Rikenellaceae bacterium]
MKNIETLIESSGQGVRISYGEAVEIEKQWETEDLCQAAGRLRKVYTGNHIDTCSIMNARSGKCSEDCKWCSQSMFHNTGVDIYPLVGLDEALREAMHNASKGVHRFSLVTSGRTLSDRDVDRSAAIYRAIGRRCDIYLCASMGLLTKEQLQKLYDSGVRRYHCNLESAPSYFPHLCTTHTTEEKIRTIRWAQEVGMEVCSGGIIGMGETMEQRIELAVTLRELSVKSIPVNILNPVKGTALENTPPLSDVDILRSVAMFRIVNPDAHIRFAGGRNLIKHLEGRLLHSGISASIVGDMLTTSGSDIDTDKEMFKNEGFTL